ncbi:MAG: flagellar biosynthesis anti-sigma factor FlgM [Planctomycetota bacterium]|nr:flagellar biosynthesis anti-sigma factor FlgM [Planctomycetota bacterium]
MQVYGLAQLHSAQSINAPHTLRANQPASSTGRTSFNTTDQLDISAEASLASRLSDIPDIRHDRVAAIKAQIANGTYETADKLDGALSALLDEIG